MQKLHGYQRPVLVVPRAYPLRKKLGCYRPLTRPRGSLQPAWREEETHFRTTVGLGAKVAPARRRIWVDMFAENYEAIADLL